MVLRLLQEHEFARLSLYNHGRLDDIRERPVVYGEIYVTMILSSVLFDCILRHLSDMSRLTHARIHPVGLRIRHLVLRCAYAPAVGELLEEPDIDHHRHVESDMGPAVSGRYRVQQQ